MSPEFVIGAGYTVLGILAVGIILREIVRYINMKNGGTTRL